MRGTRFTGPVRAGLFCTALILTPSCSDMLGPPWLQLPETAHLSINARTEMSHPARFVLQDSLSWPADWLALFPDPAFAPPAPQVDFSREMVIVAALGMRPTSGYAIRVEAAGVLDGAYRIFVRTTSPGRNCFVLQSYTYPIDIVRVPRVVATVQFRERHDIRDCSAW